MPTRIIPLLVALLLLAKPLFGQSSAQGTAQSILRQAARSNAEAAKGVEISQAAKRACVVASDTGAERFINGGQLNLEGWLAVATEKSKLAAISCITAEREHLKKARRAEFERCKPVLQKIAAGMSNERAMALAMSEGCWRYLMP